MARQSLVFLLRKLLDVILLGGQRSLRWLLHIFSYISRSIRTLTGDKDKYTKQKELGPSTSANAEPVFLACSLNRNRPPPARSNTRQMTYDSFTIDPGRFCASPTRITRGPSISISPTAESMDNQRSNALELSSLGETPSPLDQTSRLSTPATFTIDNQASATPEFCSFPAEVLPAGLGGFPRKEMKSFLPSETSRYDRNIPIKSIRAPWEFEPMETTTVYREPDVPGWSHCVQPEGQPYFLHASERFPHMTFLTEENLCDDAVLAESNSFVTAFERRAESDLPPPYGCNFGNLNVEVVLELRQEWYYYIVDLDKHWVFWLDNCVLDDPVLPLHFGVENRDYLRHIFDREYWQHIEYFPSHRELQEGLLEEILAILSHWHVDKLLSTDSTAPYNDDEFRSLIGLVKGLQSLHTVHSSIPYVVNASARIMVQITTERFYNLFGLYGARLTNAQSVRGTKEAKRSPLITILSPVLFYAPEVHFTGLERLWVDQVVRFRLWDTFQIKVESDWKEFILTSTVLLTSNVSFLAIPSVLTNQLENRLLTSPSAVLSQVSVIFSLGSIIVGLLLIRQMRAGEKESVYDRVDFLVTRNHKRLGLETLAILFSLPYALLMWGMATFLAAVTYVCFFSLGGNPPFSVRLIYAIVWLFVMVMIIWTILVGWQKNTYGKLDWESMEASSHSKIKTWLGKLAPGDIDLSKLSTALKRSIIPMHRPCEASNATTMLASTSITRTSSPTVNSAV